MTRRMPKPCSKQWQERLIQRNTLLLELRLQFAPKIFKTASQPVPCGLEWDALQPSDFSHWVPIIVAQLERFALYFLEPQQTGSEETDSQEAHFCIRTFLRRASLGRFTLCRRSQLAVSAPHLLSA